MSQTPSHRVESRADETPEAATADDQREVAELQRLFEDVTGTEEVVDEQEPDASSRDATDEPELSSDAMDDGLTEAIDDPDVDTTM